MRLWLARVVKIRFFYILFLKNVTFIDFSLKHTYLKARRFKVSSGVTYVKNVWSFVCFELSKNAPRGVLDLRGICLGLNFVGKL